MAEATFQPTAPPKPLGCPADGRWHLLFPQSSLKAEGTATSMSASSGAGEGLGMEVVMAVRQCGRT